MTIGSFTLFAQMCEDNGLPRPEREWEFHHTRNWRLDIAWPSADHMLALEVEGGAWVRGRHTRAKGFLNDMEKYNALTCEGWRLLRVTPDKLHTMETIELVRRALLG